MATNKEKTIPQETDSIMSLWTATDGERKKEDLDLNLRMLHAEGNKDLINKQIAINNAEKALSAAKMNAMTNANFTAIAAASLHVEAAKVEFDRARKLFVSLFNIEPSV